MDPSESSQPLVGLRQTISPNAVSFVVACVLLLVAASAAAQDQQASQRVRLSYFALEGCPDATDFSRDVRRRTAQVEFTQDSAAPRALRVIVTASEGTYRGLLELWAADGHRLLRSFSDASCKEVVSALALVTALSIEARTEPPRLTHLESEAKSGPGSAPTGGPSVSRAASANSTAAAGPEPGRSSAPQRTAHGRRWAWGAGASLALLWGPAPEPVVVPSPLLQVERLPLDWSSLRLRVAPVLAQTGVLGPSASMARFRWLALRSEVCTLRTVVGDWAFGPCLLVDVGLLSVRGDLAKSFERTRGWYAVGLGADVSWRAGAFAKLGMGLLLPLVRDRFVILPDQEIVHQPPLVAGHFSLAAGVLFP